MALIFPLVPADLVDQLRIETVTWNLVQQQEVSGLGSGEGLSHDLGPAIWEGDCATIEHYHAEVEKWRARFNALDGSNNTFLLYNPAARQDNAQFAALTGYTPHIGSINANRKELGLAGLPPGWTVPWGSYAAIDYGSPNRRALVQFVADSLADGGGETAQIEFRPHLRPGIVTGLGVSFIAPAAKVKLLPGSLRVETVGALTSRLRFSARQTLAAGGSALIPQPTPDPEPSSGTPTYFWLGF